jgi:pimeloyl-ACP methyl ester carboxylesterase
MDVNKIPKSRYLTVDDGRISYFEKDNQKDSSILLLHGWMSIKEIFTTFAQHLSTHFNIYAIDLPGFGRSEEISYSKDFHEYSDLIKKFVELKEIGKVSVYGTSLGGVFAMRLAIDYPDLIDQLVIKNAPPTNAAYNVIHDSLAAKILLNGEWIWDLPGFKDIFIRQWISSTDKESNPSCYWKQHSELREEILFNIRNHYRNSFNKKVIRESMKLMREFDYVDDLERNEVKGTFIISKDDKWLKEEHLSFDKLRNFNKVFVENDRHFTLDENLVEIAQIVIRETEKKN